MIRKLTEKQTYKKEAKHFLELKNSRTVKFNSRMERIKGSEHEDRSRLFILKKRGFKDEENRALRTYRGLTSLTHLQSQSENIG